MLYYYGEEFGITPEELQKDLPEFGENKFAVQKMAAEDESVSTNLDTSGNIEPPKPENEKDEDENEVPRELWPWRDELLQWIEEEGRHTDALAFLQYRKGTKHKLIAGMGFYHRPAKDIISLSVPEFKKMREEMGMTPAQILFGWFHEFAHLKTMGELDFAGKKNHLEQYIYERKKGYFIRDEHGKMIRMTAKAAYRQYYNICEDAIVNQLVFNTGTFGRNVSEDSRRNNQEIVDLYTNKFFSVYLEVGQGNGDCIYNPEAANPENKYIYVGNGNGNIRVANKEDYEAGFDWAKVIPPMHKTAQFMTFFMKNQMINLPAQDVRDEVSNSEGKHRLDSDVGIVFTRPLQEVYQTLLTRFVEQYKDEPDKMELYLRFMCDQIQVPKYKEQKGKVIEDGFNTHTNVAGRGNNGPIYPDYHKIDVNFATQLFGKKIKDSLISLGLPSDFSKVANVKYLDIFNQFKQIDKSRNVFGTKPLKYSLVARTSVMRNILEPIFSLLCVLDDSFKMEIPSELIGDGDEGKSGSRSGKEGSKFGSGDPPEIKEKPMWEPGDEVKNDDKSSPYYKRRGVVTRIEGDENGITLAEVEYYEEEDKLADRPLAGETEIVTDPNKNLILMQKKSKSKGQGQRSPKDIRKIEYEEDDENGDDPKEDKGDTPPEDGDEGADDSGENDDGESKEGGDESEDGKEGEDKKPVKPEGGKEPEPTLSEDDMSGYEKALRRMIEEDEREKKVKDIENEKKNPEYQRKKSKNDKINKLLKSLKDKSEGSESDDLENDQLPPEEMIKKFLELEELLKVPANKMAEAWLQIIKNISRKIDTVVDKYYRQGKPDIKKLQKMFPEIEFGAEVDRRLIHSLIVEKIKVELKPKMLRVILLIDASGSMSSALDQVRMTVMLLNSSLRNFRLNFQQIMTGIVSDKNTDLDVVCDTEIITFSNHVSLIKPFDVTNLSFLTDETKIKNKPSLLGLAEKETLSTIKTFQRLIASGGTADALCWLRLIQEHENNPELKQLLKNGFLTEIIFQISDGDINEVEDIQTKEDESKSKRINALELIKYFKENYAVGVGGIAIGGESARTALQVRHGENVRNADTADQLADEFSGFLTDIIKAQIEKPMMEILEKIENSL